MLKRYHLYEGYMRHDEELAMPEDEHYIKFEDIRLLVSSAINRSVCKCKKSEPFKGGYDYCPHCGGSIKEYREK